MPSVKDMQPLIPAATIQARIQQLAAEIDRDSNGEAITMIGVLKGSFIFLADLIRQLKAPVEVEFIGVSSYEGTSSSGQVRITHDLGKDVSQRHLILVEDIIDSGLTIDYLLDIFALRGPKSLKVCTLLSKPESHSMQHKLDYVGFEIDKDFVVGYGLDLDGQYRQLPDIMKVTALEDGD